MASWFARLGSLVVVAVALSTFVGCAAPGVNASSPREPGGAFPPSLGALRADSPLPEARIAPEREAADRGNDQAREAREPRTFRIEYCRRCSN